MNYFELMKQITRDHAAKIRRMEGHKPLCVECQVPCDWESREYRALRLCPSCYYSQPPIRVIKKEALCPKP